MKAYIDIGRRILDEGVWLSNVRTGQKTLAIIGTTFELTQLHIRHSNKLNYKSKQPIQN
jgi:hypothetical protein